MFASRFYIVAFAAFLAAAGSFAAADSLVPDLPVRNFGVWMDNNEDGIWESHTDTKIACITNMLQYLSAGTSYGYKQYDNEKGADLSANPNSSDGLLLDGTGNTSHQTWLTPEPNTMQFWFGFSRLDHDPSNIEYADAARGYNFNVIMHKEQVVWSNELGRMYHVPSAPGAPVYNNVQLSIDVKGSTMSSRAILSDEFTEDANDFPSNPYYTKELPRVPVPTSGDPYPVLDPTQELQQVAPTAGWDQSFYGDWEYREHSTDGAVFGNLMPDENNPGQFVIRVRLDRLYDPQIGPSDPNGIKKLVFYSFPLATGTYDPFDPNSYAQAGFVKYELDLTGFQNGDYLFFTDCCDPTPEPITLALLAVGGAGLTGTAALRRRRAGK